VAVGNIVLGMRNRQERLQNDSAHKKVYLNVLRDWSAKGNSNSFVAGISPSYVLKNSATAVRSKNFVPHSWRSETRRMTHISRHGLVIQVSEGENSFWGTLLIREKQSNRVVSLMRRSLSDGAASVLLESQNNVVGLVYEANEVAEAGNSRKAIRMIYNHYKDLIIDEKIAVIDDTFEALDYETINTDVIIAMLTITIPVKDRLINRAEALDSARRLIDEREEPEEDLLVGL